MAAMAHRCLVVVVECGCYPSQNASVFRTGAAAITKTEVVGVRVPPNVKPLGRRGGAGAAQHGNQNDSGLCALQNKGEL